MTKAERWTRRYQDLQKRAREIQARADSEINGLSNEWPTVKMKTGSFTLTPNGNISSVFNRNWPEELSPEDALRLAHWIIETYSESEA